MKEAGNWLEEQIQGKLLVVESHISERVNSTYLFTHLTNAHLSMAPNSQISSTLVSLINVPHNLLIFGKILARTFLFFP